jgi:hypothetical protein
MTTAEKEQFFGDLPRHFLYLQYEERANQGDVFKDREHLAGNIDNAAQRCTFLKK